MRKNDLISGLFLSVCGIMIVIMSLRFPIGTFDNPGYGLFPLFIGILLSILSIVLFIRSILRSPSGREAPSGGHKRLYKVIAVIFFMLLYALTLDWLGFLLVTFVLLFLLFKVIGDLSLKLSVGGAIGTSFISYLLFKVLLNVPLPAGPWGM